MHQDAGTFHYRSPRCTGASVDSNDAGFVSISSGFRLPSVGKIRTSIASIIKLGKTPRRAPTFWSSADV
ncbi:beta-Ala-His dipeptidase isoform X2 [Anopheles sinensis]|uniref:Beta-Ala-His dipeptidase isoform X2 n=1 Tax=Anopheles sinensis TaxID=74873 RepID=A0A084VHE9_ANOSI|nr:beta-Ala-His dipeptidase isoform X2 [Anopheles sinensis]